MNRRQFLKSIIATVPAIAIPKTVEQVLALTEPRRYWQLDGTMMDTSVWGVSLVEQMTQGLSYEDIPDLLIRCTTAKPGVTTEKVDGGYIHTYSFPSHHTPTITHASVIPEIERNKLRYGAWLDIEEG